MFRGFVTAVRTLSILPVPCHQEAEPDADALFWFPLVGCLLGSILLGLARALSVVAGGWNEGVATILVAAGAILTRGLHLDGLSDSADGFGGGRTRERTLAIMKDSHVGAFGVVALILILIGKWAAFSRLTQTGALHWVIPAFVVSRMAMVELAVCLPYAREEGTGAPFVNGARTAHRIGALLTSLSLVVAFSGPAGIILIIAGWAASRILGRWFQRRVAGVTGDLLGASSELVETGLLLSCAAANAWLARLTV